MMIDFEKPDRRSDFFGVSWTRLIAILDRRCYERSLKT